MSLRRSLRRTSAKAQDPREVFAREIGQAMERFGKAGGSLEQASASLLRYSAQALIVSPTAVSSTQFANMARDAFARERSAISAPNGHEN